MALAGEIIAKLRLDIGDYQKGIDEAKDGLSGFSSKTADVAKVAVGAFATIVTAISGVVAAGANMALEQEKNLAKVQAQTGMTEKQMEAFKESADNLFANGRGEYEDIYDALSKVKTVLGESGEEAEQTAESALLLSEIFGYDVADSIRMAESANKAWGSTSAESFDMITALSQQAGDKADDLLDTFSEYAPVLSEAGFSQKEFGDILNSGMEAGAFNFDKIGDTLKEFNVRLTDGSTQANGMADALFGSAEASAEFFEGISNGTTSGSDALKIITGKLAEIEDPIERNTLGVSYFGSMWEDLGGDVVMAMGTAEGSLMEVEGAMASAGDAVDDNLTSKITGIRNQFIIWAKEVGENLLPEITNIVDYIVQNMPAILETMTAITDGIIEGIGTIVGTGVDFIKWVDDNKLALTVFAGILTALALPAIVGYYNGILTRLIPAFVLWVTSTYGMITSNYALGLSVMATHAKMLLFFGIFGLLIAGAYLLYKNWDAVSQYLAKFGITAESVSGFLTNLKDRMLEFGSAIKTAISGGDFTPLLDGVKFLIPSIISFLIGGIPSLLFTAYRLLSAIAEGMGLTVPELITKIAEIVTNLINQFTLMLPMLVNTGVSALMSIIEGIVSVLPMLIEAAISLIMAIVNALVESLPQLLSAGVEILFALIAGILSILPILLEAVATIFMALIGALLGNLPQMMDSGIQILEAIIKGILSILPALLQAGLMLIVSIAGALISNLPRLLEAGVSILIAVVTGILSVLPQLLGAALRLIALLATTLFQNAPQILAAGVKLIAALVTGIGSMLGQVGSAVGKIGASILSKFQGISLASVGKNLISGLWSGIGSMASWIHSKISGFASGITDKIKGIFGIHSPSRVFKNEIGVMLVRGLNDGINKLKNLPVKSMTDISDNVIGAFENIGSLSISPPAITAISSGYVDVAGTVEAAGMETSESGTNYNAPIVQVENMTVRNEDDIRQVSRELFNMQRSHDRSKGGK